MLNLYIGIKQWDLKTKLSIPEPQLKDYELELIGKMNSAGIVENGEDHEATRALIGSMTQNRQTPSPMRTPRYQDSLIRETQTYLALKTQRLLPLLGGEEHTQEEILVIHQLGI